MIDSYRVVAWTRSKKGGWLDCGHRAAPKDLIAKVDTGERGHTTGFGNGAGAWICEHCANYGGTLNDE